jgi:four helix bundle protein
MRRVGSRQYLRRMRQARERRILPFPEHCAGLASELEYHFLLARDLNFVSEEDYDHLNRSLIETKRMLASLVCKVEADRRVS